MSRAARAGRGAGWRRAAASQQVHSRQRGWGWLPARPGWGWGAGGVAVWQPCAGQVASARNCCSASAHARCTSSRRQPAPLPSRAGPPRLTAGRLPARRMLERTAGDLVDRLEGQPAGGAGAGAQAAGPAAEAGAAEAAPPADAATAAGPAPAVGAARPRRERRAARLAAQQRATPAVVRTACDQ